MLLISSWLTAIIKSFPMLQAHSMGRVTKSKRENKLYVQVECYLSKHTVVPRMAGGPRDMSMPRCCYSLIPRVDKDQILTQQPWSPPCEGLTPVHFDNIAKCNQLTRALSLIIWFLPKLRAETGSLTNKNDCRASVELLILQATAEADITASKRYQATPSGGLKLL